MRKVLFLLVAVMFIFGCEKNKITEKKLSGTEWECVMTDTETSYGGTQYTWTEYHTLCFATDGLLTVKYMYTDTQGDSEDYSYAGTYSLSDDGKIVTISEGGESVALVYSDDKLIMNVESEVMIFLKKK